MQSIDDDTEAEVWADFHASVAMSRHASVPVLKRSQCQKQRQGNDRVGHASCNGFCTWNSIVSSAEENMFVCSTCGDWHRCIDNMCLRAILVKGGTWVCPVSGAAHSCMIHDGDDFSCGHAGAPEGSTQPPKTTVLFKSDPTVYGMSRLETEHNVAFHHARSLLTLLMCSPTRYEVEGARVTRGRKAGKKAAIKSLLAEKNVCRAIETGYATFEKHAGGVVVRPSIASKDLDTLAHCCARVYCAGILQLGDQPLAKPRANYAALATLYQLREGVPGLFDASPICQLLPDLKSLEQYSLQTSRYTHARKACARAMCHMRTCVSQGCKRGAQST
jgi:hypothetical protein